MATGRKWLASAMQKLHLVGASHCRNSKIVLAGRSIREATQQQTVSLVWQVYSAAFALLTQVQESFGIAAGLCGKEGNKSAWDASTAPHNVVSALIGTLNVSYHVLQPLLWQLVQFSGWLQQQPAAVCGVVLSA